MAKAALFLLLLLACSALVWAAGDDRICCNHDNDDDDIFGGDDDDNDNDDGTGDDDDNDGVDFARESWYLYIPSDVVIECHREILTVAENTTPDLTGYAFEANGCHITSDQCDEQFGNLAFTAWCFQSGNDDDFGFGLNDYRPNFVSDVSAATCGNSFIVTRTWESGSTCNGANIGSTQQITVIDSTPPELNVPDDMTVECEPDINTVGQSNDDLYGVATVTDLCNQPAVISQATAVGGDSCTRVITRTFGASDGCFTSQGQQVVTVVDTTPPVIEHPLAIVLNCTDAIPNLTVRAHDGCQDEDIVAAVSSETVFPGACTGDFTIERVYTAADACGNEVTHTQLFIVEDTEPPVVNPSDQDAIYITGCELFLPAPLAPTATDACGTAFVDVEGTAILETHETGVFTQITTYTAYDDCGNSVSFEELTTVISSNLYSFGAVDEVFAAPFAPFLVEVAFNGFVCDDRGRLVVSFSPLELDFTAGAGAFCVDAGEGSAICPLEFFPTPVASFVFELDEDLPARSTVTIDYQIQDAAPSAYIEEFSTRTLVRFP